MKKRPPTQTPVVKARGARPGDTRFDVAESFRSARSALDQIATDVEHLRRHAASLMKGGRRPAK